ITARSAENGEIGQRGRHGNALRVCGDLIARDCNYIVAISAFDHQAIASRGIAVFDRDWTTKAAKVDDIGIDAGTAVDGNARSLGGSDGNDVGARTAVDDRVFPGSTMLFFEVTEPLRLMIFLLMPL